MPLTSKQSTYREVRSIHVSSRRTRPKQRKLLTIISDKMSNSLVDTYINISGEPAASFRDKLANTFFENVMKFANQ